MKKIISLPLFLLTLVMVWSCNKNGNYPGGVVSPYISIYDVKDLYKGTDVTLTKEKLFGSSKITGVVVSDHSGKNLPCTEACFFLQNACKRGYRPVEPIDHNYPVGHLFYLPQTGIFQEKASIGFSFTAYFSA